MRSTPLRENCRCQDIWGPHLELQQTQVLWISCLSLLKAVTFLRPHCSGLQNLQDSCWRAGQPHPGILLLEQLFSWCSRVPPNALCGSDSCFLQQPELLCLIICLSTFLLAAQTLDCYTTVAELCHFKKPASHCPR